MRARWVEGHRSYRLFESYRSPVGFWFRIYGYGLAVMDRTLWEPLFSVRYVYTKEYRIAKEILPCIGKYGIRFLTPNRIHSKRFEERTKGFEERTG